MSRCTAFRIVVVAAAAVSSWAPRVDAQTLRGSAASVDLMYTSAHARDLDFLRTPDEIYQAAMAGALKLISVTEDLELDEARFPFVLPNTLRFADSLAAEYHAACGERLVVTSGARPLDEQPRNASPKSVHPTGMAVDFRKPTVPACLTWLRKNLVVLEDEGVIEATEERHPPHFHVAVLRQAREPRLTVATRTPADAKDTAAKIVASSAGDVATAPKRDSSRETKKRGETEPSVASYRVHAGDNLWTIAKRHHTTPARLQALNGLHNSTLRPGQTLRLR
jgi:hypothetical protein